MKVFKLEVDGGDEVCLMGIFSSMVNVKAAVYDNFNTVYGDVAELGDNSVELREATEDEKGDFDTIYFPAFKDAPSDLSMMDAMEENMFLQYRVTECELDEVIKIK